MTGRTTALAALIAYGLIGAARAELTCPETVHMAGRVKSGKAVAHTFTLVNRGTGVIDLTEVKPGCGCLRPDLERVTLGPGEQCKLTVHVNTVTQPAGVNNWKTTVRYREGAAARELVLTLRAAVVPEVQVQPANLLLHASGPITAEFKLIDRREQPFKATKLVCGSAHVRASLSPPRREGEMWARTVTLDVLRTCPEGRHDDVLKVLTTDPEYPEIQMPFTILKRMPGKAQAMPPSLELSGKAGQPVPAKIVLLSADGEQPLRGTRVETSHDCIRCTYATGPGPRLTLRIEVDGSRVGPDGLDGEVKMHLSSPTPQVVTIPVRLRR